jgi:hypothetical protein
MPFKRHFDAPITARVVDKVDVHVRISLRSQRFIKGFQHLLSVSVQDKNPKMRGKWIVNWIQIHGYYFSTRDDRPYSFTIV